MSPSIGEDLPQPFPKMSRSSDWCPVMERGLQNGYFTAATRLKVTEEEIIRSPHLCGGSLPLKKGTNSHRAQKLLTLEEFCYACKTAHFKLKEQRWHL